MKQRIIAALFLAGFAGVALAQSSEQVPGWPNDSDTPIVQDVNSCPPGFWASSPSYKLENGHLVSDGWACESLYKDGK